MADYSRKYYTDIGLKPYLFYVVFGVNTASLKDITLSSLPKGIEVIPLNRGEHEKYMESLLSKETKASLILPDSDLSEKCEKSDNWLLLHGRIDEDRNLHYLASTAEVIKSLFSLGAVGVMDAQSKRLYNAESFIEKLCGDPTSAYANVSMVRTKFDDRSEFRTHGMMKLGRPDILVTNIDGASVNDAAELVSQMVFYSAEGAYFGVPVKLQLSSGREYTITPVLSRNGENLTVDWSKNK